MESVSVVPLLIFPILLGIPYLILVSRGTGERSPVRFSLRGLLIGAVLFCVVTLLLLKSPLLFLFAYLVVGVYLLVATLAARRRKSDAHGVLRLLACLWAASWLFSVVGLRLLA